MKQSLWSAIMVMGAGLGLVGTGCHREAARPESAPLPVVAVRTQPVESRRHLAVEEVVGTIRAKTRATVEVKISGRIEQLLVVPGQRVAAGDLLAELDAREITARLDQALATRDQATNDLKRYVVLLQQKAATQQEFDAVQARFRVAQAAVVEAETQLGYARVTAPFAGVVTRKLADAGDLAAPGKPLVELEDPQTLRLEADVPEALIGKVDTGQRLPVRVPALTNQLEGVVSEVAPAADPNSRTFLVKFDLPGVAGLRAGQFGRVAVPVSESPILRVPAAALVQRGQLDLLFVVETNVARLRLVKPGKRFGDEVEVLAGVTRGEIIVTDGASRLADGQPVEVKP